MCSCRWWMPALVLIGYWVLFTGITFVALQYLQRKPIKSCSAKSALSGGSCFC